MSPAKPEKALNDAVALHQRGDLAGAEALYRTVLKKDARHFDALHLLGVLRDQRGDRAGAITLIRQALKIQSASAEAHFNLGRLLHMDGDEAGAQSHLDQAVTLKPALACAHNELGNVHRRRGAYDAAAASFDRATRYEPGLLEAYLNLCNTYRDSCNEEKIFDAADRGLGVDPRNARLWQLRAEAGFTTGRLVEGWRDYAWRFASMERPEGVPQYDLPMWQGEDLSSKSILIWYEQGVGDQIIFASMIPGVAAAAKRCVLQTTPRLAPLFARAFPSVEVYGGPAPPETVQTLDLQSPMGSLGQWRRPSFGSFPAATDYLKADPDKIAALRVKYKSGRNTLLVGLAWRSAQVNDATEKSIGLNQWGAVLSIPGITFVNLQYGDTRAEIGAAREVFKATIIEDPAVDSLADLDTFAAQVAAMDIVISSSNTAAHMAGALGVPTWCMVPRALGSGRRWYWFGAGAYAPWYRAMTLFRQTQDNWTSVLTDIALALTSLAAKAGVTNAAPYLGALARGYASAGMIQEATKVQAQIAIPTPATRAMLGAAHAHMKNGALAEALTAVTGALEPPSADAYDLQGRILARLERYDEAVAAYRRALDLEPAKAEVHNNLGTALRRAGNGGLAQHHYAESLRLKPDHPSILLNYATALAENNHLEQSLAAYDRLIALNPDHADAHFNRAAVLLSLGRFDEGWADFKWRLRRGDVHVRHEAFPQPVWSGEDLANKHVLVWTDLGIGEEILAASFIPDTVKATRRVTLLCSVRLLALFRRSFPEAVVDVRAAPLPPAAVSADIDLQMSMAEVGAALRRGFDAFPARNTFLTADQTIRDRLRAKYLAGRENAKLVGIAWRSVHPEIGRQKSVPLEQWLPILKTPGITFVNLQYGDCQAELDALHRDHGILVINDPSVDPFGDVDPLAAQIAAMDLVVSVSNTAVHLAGGLGVPAWVLVPRGLGRLWYWFRNRAQSPWYSRTALHTPENDGDWENSIQRIASDMARWAVDNGAPEPLALARALHENGKNADALAVMTQVLSGHASAAAWNLRGDIHLALADVHAAINAHTAAATQEPNNAGYHHDLARALLADRRMAEAEDALQTAARLNTRSWEIMSDLGTAQMEQGKRDAALTSFTAALALKPDAATAVFNRGSLLRDLGRLDEAEAAFVSAVRIAPNFLPPRISLITLLGDVGQLEKAQQGYADAVQIAPQEPQIHQAMAMALLRHGALRDGFAAYEARFLPSPLVLSIRPFSAPRWNGEPLAGKSILIWTEQGVGDELLSAGMFPDVMASGASCTIECSERAAPLFRRSFEGVTVIARRDPPAPETQGAFDYQSPALSLCGILRPDLNSFPGHNGYLRADPDLTRQLRENYRAVKPGALVVGIAWDSAGRHGANKRLPLEHWAPILSQTDVTFVSLQYGARRGDPGTEGLLIDEIIDPLKSLDAAAAQVAAMDLVITVSNTAAHLAGALNVPVWTLLPDGPGCLWYWFRDRTESPWYPSMHMFRQPRPGGWPAVVDRAARALVELKAKGQL